VVDRVLYLSIAAVGIAINRSPRTCRKLLKTGHLPEPGRIITGHGHFGTRFYSPSELDQFNRAAVNTWFYSDKSGARLDAFNRELARLRKSDQNAARPPIVSDRGQEAPRRRNGAEIAQEQEEGPVRGWNTWAVISGELVEDEQEQLPDRSTHVMPGKVQCPLCPRELLFDPRAPGGPGPRLTTEASCSVHGEFLVNLPQPPTVAHGPATREDALRVATRTWERPGTEREHYGPRP